MRNGRQFQLRDLGVWGAAAAAIAVRVPGTERNLQDRTRICRRATAMFLTWGRDGSLSASSSAASRPRPAAGPGTEATA